MTRRRADEWKFGYGGCQRRPGKFPGSAGIRFLLSLLNGVGFWLFALNKIAVVKAL